MNVIPLTVVTIVKDDDEGFRRTMESLASQDNRTFESMIVDGSREPSTIPTIVETYRARGLHARYVWRQPEGIYRAMNSGLTEAHGRYTYFLNAGDELLGTNTLTWVIDSLAKGAPMWAFGEIEIQGVYGDTVVTRKWDYLREERWSFSRGRFAAHQATFVDTEVLRGIGGFSSGYEVGADYEVFLKLTRISAPLYLPRTIARFHEGGTSTWKWRTSLREFHSARRAVLQPRGFRRVLEQAGTWRTRLAMEAHRLSQRPPEKASHAE